MSDKLVKKWVSQEVIEDAERMGVEICIREAVLAAYPLNEHSITFVASTDYPKAIVDARFSQAMRGGAEQLDELVRLHAKEMLRSYDDMFYLPVFLCKKTGSYSTSSRDKAFVGYVYFSKQFICDWLGVKTVDATTRRTAKAAAESALIKLGKWSAGEVYSISIERGDEILAATTDVYGLWLADRITTTLLSDTSALKSI